MDNLQRAMASDYGAFSLGPEPPRVKPRKKTNPDEERKIRLPGTGCIYQCTVHGNRIWRAQIKIDGKKHVKTVGSYEAGEIFLDSIINRNR